MHLLWRRKLWRTSAGHGDWHQWQRQINGSTTVRMLVLALFKLGGDVLHGVGVCESGEIAGGDSLTASTASTGSAWEP